MEGNVILAVVVRWAHILSAVILVGGLIFERVAVFPALSKELDAEKSESLRQAISQRWRMVMMTVVTLLLISGFYNFFTLGMSKAANAPSYHGIFGVKFLMAFAVFAIVMILGGRKASAQMSGGRKRLLVIGSLLAVLVVLFSGVLRSLG